METRDSINAAVAQVMELGGLEILKYPDKRLYAVGRTVTPAMLKSEEFAAQTYAMETLLAGTENAVGLAAQQVGLDLRVCVLSRPFDDSKGTCDVETTVIINPMILEYLGQPRRVMEGCLSVPDVKGMVVRHKEIKFGWTDKFGKHHVSTVSGIIAQAIQHECDHLRGKLYLDIMGRTNRMRTLQKYWELHGRKTEEKTAG